MTLCQTGTRAWWQLPQLADLGLGWLWLLLEQPVAYHAGLMGQMLHLRQPHLVRLHLWVLQCNFQ